MVLVIEERIISLWMVATADDLSSLIDCLQNVFTGNIKVGDGSDPLGTEGKHVGSCGGEGLAEFVAGSDVFGNVEEDHVGPKIAGRRFDLDPGEFIECGGDQFRVFMVADQSSDMMIDGV